MKRAQENMASFFFSPRRKDLVESIDSKVGYFYANLLKIVFIQFNGKGQSADEKIEQYLEFCHSRLATMNAREIIVAREFFERGQNLKSFGKIQIGRADLFTLLKIWHGTCFTFANWKRVYRPAEKVAPDTFSLLF